MSTYFTKNNAVAVGVTPFYYMFMNGEAREGLHNIIRQMPVELILSFTNSLEEMYNYLMDVVNDTVNVEDPKQLELLESSAVSRFFADSIDTDILVWIPELLRVRNDVAESYTDVNFFIGNTDLKNLLQMTAPRVEEQMRSELDIFMDGVDTSHTDQVIQYVELGDEMVGKLKQALVIIQRKIAVIEDSYIKKDKGFLKGCYKSVIKNIEMIDHIMINSGSHDFIQELRGNLRDLGLDTRIPLYSDVAKQEREVESLSERKEYNKATLVSLERKKTIFERAIVSLTSKISGVHESVTASKYYF